MFDNIKKNLYFSKVRLLSAKGFSNKKIVPYDDEFYKKLSHTFVNGLPVSIHIKHLNPISGLGKCYDRSLYMFFCFDDALLVRADIKYLELKFGKDKAGHGWIEIDNYVYDPTSKLKFDKDLYYEIYKPTKISKCTKEEYCAIKQCKELYDDIRSTTIEDFKPYGKRRMDLISTMPLTIAIAQKSGDKEFIDELNKFINLIKYDEEEVYSELMIHKKNYWYND